MARRESEQALLREHGLEQALQRLQVRSLVITPSYGPAALFCTLPSYHPELWSCGVLLYVLLAGGQG